MNDLDAAFERWYRQEHPGLTSSLVIVAGGDTTLAGEAADEAFARAYANWHRVSRLASPGGWTYRTAVNVLRRRHRRSRLETVLLRGRPDVRTDDGFAASVDWSAETWDALCQLPARERTAVALRYIADMSTDSIAYAMGIAPGTVGSTLHAARQRLAETLSEDGGTSASPPKTSKEEPSRA